MNSDTSGIEAMQKKLRSARAELPDITKRAASRIGEAVSKDLGNAAPKGKSGGAPPAGDASGPLAKSFHAKTEQRGTGAQMTLKTKQPLKLQYVTKGTGIYVGKGLIKPKVKLALFWPGASHPVKSVRGMKGKDFVKPVLAKRKEVVRAEMQKAVQELKTIIGG